jgi:tetratricopeptide (TPR) repeat protein
MARLHHRHRLAAVVLVAASIYSPSVLADDTAAADPSSVSQSERRAADAFAAYNKKEYAAAIALYLEAYDAAPSGSILYNIARIYDMKLHNRPSAIAFYRRYVADPSAQDDLIDISNQRLRELRNAEIATAKAGALADDGAGRTDGGTVRGRDALPRAAHDAGEERRGGWSTLRWTGVALGAAGLLGVGVGGGFGLAAMSRAGTAKDQCDGNACVSQQGVDAARTARRDATVANIGFAGGGALLLTGVALYFLGGEKAGEESPVHLEARATSSTTSLQVVGRW